LAFFALAVFLANILSLLQAALQLQLAPLPLSLPLEGSGNIEGLAGAADFLPLEVIEIAEVAVIEGEIGEERFEGRCFHVHGLVLVDELDDQFLEGGIGEEGILIFKALHVKYYMRG
jgi:hypothetical protein